MLRVSGRSGSESFGPLLDLFPALFHPAQAKSHWAHRHGASPGSNLWSILNLYYSSCNFVAGVNNAVEGNENDRTLSTPERDQYAMKQKAITFAMTIAATAILTCIRADAASERVLTFTIDGDLLDAAEVVLSNKGIKITNRLGNMFWFANKPAECFLANPENQTYFKQTTEEYVKDLREDYRPLKYDRLERKPKTLSDGTKAEMVTAYLTIEKGKEVKVAEVTCLKNSGVAPAVNQMWCTIMGLPQKDFSLPIGCFQNARKVWRMKEAFQGGKDRWLNVALPKKVAKKPVEERILKIPTNYKQAKDMASLYLSADGSLKENDLADFFISTPKKK